MSTRFVEGEDRGDIRLYALSTCVWCKKTKALLQELQVAHTVTDVDLLEKEDRVKTMEEVRKWNPACSFPSLVINNQTCIVGFDEAKIRETLKR